MIYDDLVFMELSSSGYGKVVENGIWPVGRGFGEDSEVGIEVRFFGGG